MVIRRVERLCVGVVGRATAENGRERDVENVSRALHCQDWFVSKLVACAVLTGKPFRQISYFNNGHLKKTGGPLLSLFYDHMPKGFPIPATETLNGNVMGGWRCLRRAEQ